MYYTTFLVDKKLPLKLVSKIFVETSYPKSKPPNFMAIQNLSTTTPSILHRLLTS